MIDNDFWYTNYDSSEIPADTSAHGDAEDKLRSSDVCYKDGSYSKDNCPSEPDCSWTGEWGDAKLCINRAPKPDNGEYYVVVMKCIPVWENW